MLVYHNSLSLSAGSPPKKKPNRINATPTLTPLLIRDEVAETYLIHPRTNLFKTRTNIAQDWRAGDSPMEWLNTIW